MNMSLTKKVTNSILSIHPVIYLFIALVVLFIIGIKIQSVLFVYPILLLSLCVVPAISDLIDSASTRINKLLVWFIILGLSIAIYYSPILLEKIIGTNSQFETFILLVWFIVFASLIVYLSRPPFNFIFGLIKKIEWKIVQKIVVFIERLLSPLYLFPIKLITYSAFYLVIFIIKTLAELLKLIIDAIKFPFKNFRNFLKSILIIGLALYLVASVFVIVDYLRTHYGQYAKFLCSVGTKEKIKKTVVRIVGGYSEGTGFFIANNQVLTNFHVISGEPSPKIIFPDGKFITPTKITGNKDADLAILFTQNDYPEMVMPLPNSINFKDEEPLIATGFAMGTDLVGDATVVRGNFVDYRTSREASVSYIQTNISLVEGMSGGPLTDQCGAVAGINTQGLAGLSLFISGNKAKELIPEFTDQEIEKIKVDPSKSPEDAVNAFYIYLKARQMEDGFKLLSREYLQKTNFEEWTNRFLDIIDVDIIKTEKIEKTKDTVFLKFVTKNWVKQEVEYHFYEGTWQTVLEDGVYKMLKSNIKEVKSAERSWFYE